MERSASTTSDVLTVRRAARKPLQTRPAVQASESTCRPRSAHIDPGIVPFYVASNDPADFDLRTVTCDPGTLAPSGVTSREPTTSIRAICSAAPADKIPTLKRIEVVNGNYQIVSLAEGVINLQFEYGFDTDGDGATDVYPHHADPAGGADYSRWENV